MASAPHRSIDRNAMSWTVPHTYENEQQHSGGCEGTRVRGDTCRKRPVQNAGCYHAQDESPQKTARGARKRTEASHEAGENRKANGAEQDVRDNRKDAVRRSSTAGIMASTNVCKVKGTGPKGSMTWAEAANSATMSPARAIRLASMLLPHS